MIPQDFGGLLPYIVRELQWKVARVAPPQALIRTEGLYGWGAAALGLNEDPALTVAQVGPGFCNSQFGGSAPNRICIDREDGNFRLYLDITRYYLDRWRATWR